MDNGLSSNTDSVSAISTLSNSNSSSATFNDGDYSAVSTPKNNKHKSKKKLMWVSNVLNLQVNG